LIEAWSYVDGENVAITSLTIILEPFGSDLKHFFGRNGLTVFSGNRVVL
jgi:hypothetical protein